MKTLYLLFVLLVYVSVNQSDAQSITFVQPDNITVCQASEFQIKIKNTKATPLENIEVTLKFPCEAVYVTESINGAKESDISDLSKPKFTMENIEGSQEVTISFLLDFPCAVHKCINSGETFSNKFSMTYDGGNLNNVTSPIYNVETPYLIFTKIEKPVMNGSKGHTLHRTITIRNTRLGSVKSFVFKDTHGEGISVSTNMGQDISTVDTALIVKFSSNDFKHVGDGDDLFEFNEELTLTENINITTCAYELLHAQSVLEVVWGCHFDICDGYSYNAIVNIDVNRDFGPNLIFTPQLSEPQCYCNDQPVEQSIEIKNISRYNDAKDIRVDIRQLYHNGYIIGDSLTVIAGNYGYSGINDPFKIPAVFSEPTTQPCTGEETYRSFYFILPRISTRFSERYIYKISWNTVFCSEDSCIEESNEWSYQYHYFKDCALPEDRYHQSNRNINVESNDFIFKTKLDKAGVYKGGKPQDITYHIDCPLLKDRDGKLIVEFQLPCGMTLDNPEWRFADTIPSNIVIDDQDTLTKVRLEYDTPLDATSGEIKIPTLFGYRYSCFPWGPPPYDSLITSCPDSLICQRPPNCDPRPGFFKILSKSSIVFNEDCPMDCVPSSCDEESYKFEYPTNNYCFDTIPGYLDYEFNVFRTTFGLPDNDDDHRPDSTGVIDMSKIRTDRAVMGDTVRMQVKGVVKMDVEGASLARCLVELKIGLISDNWSFSGNSKKLYRNLVNIENGLININNTLHIKKHNDNSILQLNNIKTFIAPYIKEDTVIYIFDLSPDIISANSGELPLGFIYEQGDSIIFDADFVFNDNYYNYHGLYSYFPVVKLSINSRFFLSNDFKALIDEIFTCNCHCDTLEFAAINTSVNYGDCCGYSIYPCFSIGDLPFYATVGVADNFFPYEYKPTAILKEFLLPLWDGLDYQGAYIKSVKANGVELSDISVPYNINYSKFVEDHIEWNGPTHLGRYVYKYDNLPSLIWDDNLQLRITYSYKDKCSFKARDPISYGIKTSADFELLPLNKGYKKHIHYKRDIRRLLYGRNPNLRVVTDESNKTAFNDTITWDILGLNNTNIDWYWWPADAPNSFIQPISSTKKVDFKLLNLKTNEYYIPENGIYQLGTIFKGNYLGSGNYQDDTIFLRLTAINHSCAKEDITIKYGWSCEPYTDPFNQTPCVEQEIHCSVVSAQGVLEIDPDNQAISAPLCEQMPWSEIEIFDAGNGAIYNMQVELQFPPGLSYQPNTAEIAYPTEDGNYFSIDDPIDIGGGIYRWSIHDILDSLLAHGLPGVLTAPLNSLSLRFKTKTNCDFIAGSYIIYEVSAEKICGEPTNTVAKVSKSLNISGITAPYNAAITLSSDENQGCEDHLEISLGIHYDTPPTNNDQLIMQLPPYISYLPGSCSGNMSSCAPVVEGNILTWDLEAGKTDFDLVFSITGFGSGKCKSLRIPIYTTAVVNAHCTTSDEDCSIKVITGSTIVPIEIERPVYRIESFATDTIVSQNGINFTARISNFGIPNEDPLTIKLYYDNDGNGQYSAGDEYIDSYSFDVAVDTIASLFRFTNNQIAPHDLCKLLLVVEEDANCICSGDAFPLQTPVFLADYRTDTICSGEEIQLGIPSVSGNNYHWENTDFISCDDCSETIFKLSNNGNSMISETLILSEQNSDGCIIRYEYTVFVDPKPRILSAPVSICQGESAILFASQGQSYYWEGAGIDDATEQIQTVFPSETSIYRVTITDDIGCVATDSVSVIVNEKPVADAGEDISVCNGSNVQLNAVQTEGVTYFWTPGFPLLDDPTLPNPTVLTKENSSFTLTVSNENCTATDEVNVSFYDGVDLQVSVDDKKCLGDTVTVVVSGADSYKWSPWYQGMCESTACDTVRFVPENDVHFVIKGETTEGCKDSISVDVDMIEDEILHSQMIQICEGTSIEIFGKERTEPGTYCDTITYSSGCMEISCVELSFHEIIETSEVEQICQGESITFDGQEITESGKYCQELKSVNGCDSIFCLIVEVLDLPEITIEADTEIINIGSSVQISVVEDYPHYEWTSEQFIDCYDCQTINVKPEKTDTFQVEVTDINGCKNVGSIRIKVLQGCEIEEILIPNAFTPDNNGKNDFFRIANLEDDVDAVHISIFNRWGEQVYSARGNRGWDGMYKGEPAPPEVYIYVITIECKDGDNRVFKGDLTLIK